MKIVVTEKIDFVEPYRVQLLPSLSTEAKPEISWTFSKLQDAVEVAQDLAKRNDCKHYIFGDDVTEEASKFLNVVNV